MGESFSINGSDRRDFIFDPPPGTECFPCTSEASLHLFTQNLLFFLRASFFCQTTCGFIFFCVMVDETPCFTHKRPFSMSSLSYRYQCFAYVFRIATRRLGFFETCDLWRFRSRPPTLSSQNVLYPCGPFSASPRCVNFPPCSAFFSNFCYFPFSPGSWLLVSPWQENLVPDGLWVRFLPTPPPSRRAWQVLRL